MHYSLSPLSRWNRKFLSRSPLWRAPLGPLCQGPLPDPPCQGGIGRFFSQFHNSLWIHYSRLPCEVVPSLCPPVKVHTNITIPLKWPLAPTANEDHSDSSLGPTVKSPSWFPMSRASPRPPLSRGDRGVQKTILIYKHYNYIKKIEKIRNISIIYVIIVIIKNTFIYI